MKGYAPARWAYRCIDRVLLSHLPARAERYARGAILRLARSAYREHIHAQSAADLAADSRSRNAGARLPDWALREIGQLSEIEPGLRGLIAPDAEVSEYCIPWDKVHLGEAYGNARRELQPTYACMVIAGAGEAGSVDRYLNAAPHPTAIVDVDGDSALQALAARSAVDYLALVKSWFDFNDRASLLTRLVLQLHPSEVRYGSNDFVLKCIARHGTAMRSVSSLTGLSDPALRGADVPAIHASEIGTKRE